MFDRFIRLTRAKKALQAGRFEEAFQLADDPMIRADRRAEELRTAARTALEHRARQRLAAGDAAGAVRDLRGMAAAGAGETLLTAARQQVEAGEARRRAGAAAIDQARRLAERGQLEAAEALVREFGDVESLGPDIRMLSGFVTARREQAARHRAAADELLAARQVELAVTEFRAGVALDATGPARPPARLVDAAAEHLARRLRDPLGRGESGAALATYRHCLSELPEVATTAMALECGAELAAALRGTLRSWGGEPADLALLQAAAESPTLPGCGPAVQEAARALLRAMALRTGGRAEDLAAALATAAGALEDPRLQAEADRISGQAAAAAQALQRARGLAAAGDLAGARARLVAVLQELPMHDEIRSEMEAIERGVREREQRLDSARAAAKEGRLSAAYGLALADAVPGSAGDDARLFAQQVRSRIDLVARGLDQVRAALHGRTSGTPAGLRHCLSRLDELAKVHADCDDLAVLRAALEAEIAGVEGAAAAAEALAGDRHGDAGAVIAMLQEQRRKLLQPDRLDACILEIADRLVAAAERAIIAGQLAVVSACLPGIEAAAAVRASLAEVAERLRTQANSRRQEAERLAALAAQLLKSRDLAGAERQCEAARQLWSDSSAVRRAEEQLAALRLHEAQICRAEALAADGDVDAAHSELGDMPPTPALLRTRIFDMKQQLARAQGLEGAFLLRVDEGGEHLVLRGETVGIGNVRDGRADLPVLAALAGRHARIVRSMSFHGGMQDTIVAEGGEVRVAGARVDSHRLRSGDRVHLGTALRLCYGLPSKRSLTASLELLGGFQVAGTDRVLLLKDRGRDGRILLGHGADVHVRVASAKGEVEVYANKHGRVYVRSDSGGTIDSCSFRGEHPVEAGALIEAAGMRFVLLPWRRES